MTSYYHYGIIPLSSNRGNDMSILDNLEPNSAESIRLESMCVEIAEREYDTLGGFILQSIGDIPSIDAEVIHDNYTFIVKSLDSNRIDKIQIINKRTNEQ